MNQLGCAAKQPVGRQTPGFTLVELLVVIGIIAVLISILLPSLAAARASAQRVACMSNMRQAGLAFVGYFNDFKGMFPPNRIPAFTTKNPTGGELYWPDLLKPYVGQKTPIPNTDPWQWFNDMSPLPAVFTCPTLGPEAQQFTPYSGFGYNNYALAAGKDPVTGWAYGGIWAKNWIKITRLRSPSQLIVLADSACYSSAGPITGFSAIYIPGDAMLSAGDRLDFRHRRTLNVLYADGHCESWSDKSLPMGWSAFFERYPWMEDWMPLQ